MYLYKYIVTVELMFNTKVLNLKNLKNLKKNRLTFFEHFQTYIGQRTYILYRSKQSLYMTHQPDEILLRCRRKRQKYCHINHVTRSNYNHRSATRTLHNTVIKRRII